jgi:activator of HSP90 ATPase
MKDFKLYVEIEATPEEIFQALTNPFTIELWSGSPAIMDTNEGTEFSLWDGDICGKNLEVIQDQKIVQEWYFGDQEEKSIVTIKLHEKKTKTVVDVLHTNIPDEDFENIKEGWREYYLGSIKDFFEEELGM